MPALFAVVDALEDDRVYQLWDLEIPLKDPTKVLLCRSPPFMGSRGGERHDGFDVACSTTHRGRCVVVVGGRRHWWRVVMNCRCRPHTHQRRATIVGNESTVR